MSKKGRTKAVKKASVSDTNSLNYWMIVAIVAIFFSVGLLFKIAFFPSDSPVTGTVSYRPAQTQTALKTDSSIEDKVQLISSNFKCACGGCGELPLIECTCDMPKGAQEEKSFMRRMLKEGLSVEQIIQLVDEKYGLKVS
jgi:hypothetical protein